MDTIEALFEEFGGPAEVGRAIGKSTEHAAAMRRRKSIPVEYWPALIASEKGRELRLSSDVLVWLHTSGAKAPRLHHGAAA